MAQRHEDERTYPVDPNLNFENAVIPVEELHAEDYASLLADAPIIAGQAEDYEWYAVINADEECYAHLLCVPKKWIPDEE